MASIERLQIEDIDEIMPYESDLFSYSPWSKDEYIYDLKNNPFAYYYKLVEDKKIIGYAGVFCLYENGEILTIGISRDYQNKGYGALLLNYLLEVAKSKEVEMMTLEVKVGNDSAIHLYEKFGFKKAVIRKGYYTDGSDAILMVKDMKGEVR